MQISNIRKVGSIVGVIFVLVAAVGIFLNQNKGSVVNPQASEKVTEASSSGFEMNAAEIMFAQMMIPHHEQAVIMAELALVKSTDKEIMAIASEIKMAQSPEIIQMKSWLDKVGAGYMMGHHMGMNGMLSDSDLAVLKSANGKKFDKLFLNGMIAHHEGAIEMASSISNSKNTEIKKLYLNVVSSQSAEITVMKAMLLRLN
jgi:uncharacterized protein (DUF305 family)